MNRCFLCEAPCGISTDEEGRPICANLIACVGRRPRVYWRPILLTKPSYHCVIMGLTDPPSGSTDHE